MANILLRGNCTMKDVIAVMRKVDEAFLQPLQENYEVIISQHSDISLTEEELAPYKERIVALWTTLDDKISAELMATLPKLQVIANMAVGYNNIDLAAAKERGITICNTPDVLTNTTADLAFGLLMSAARRLPQAEKSLRNGEWTAWEPMGYAGMDIYGASIGIIGMGRIGEAVAKRATGFDMDIYYHNRSRKPEAEEQLGAQYTSLENILKTCQFVVLFSPLTDETRGMIGKEQIALMREDAVLVNAARGEIVDEEALYEALKANKIFGAGLDVFAKEPIAKDNPLLTLPNVVALPHMGSASIATRTEMAKRNVRSILSVLNNEEPLFAVK